MPNARRPRLPARRALPLVASLAALVALAAGCSSDAPSAPDQGATATLDVGRLFGELTVPAVPVAGALPFAAPTVSIPASCPYAAASQTFVCPPFTSGGLTVSLSYALLDAGGKSLSTPDRNAAASMRTVGTVAGTVTLPASSGPGGTFTVSQRQELTLSGLLTSTHRLDGTSTARVDGTVTAGGATIPVSTTMTQTIAGLAYPAGAAAGAQQWPASGTITVDATTSTGASAAATTRMVMTFDGTSTVTLTLTSGGTTQRCTLNLASPGAAPSCTG